METNRYARQRLQGNAAAMARWISVNATELAKFLGLVMIMGMIYLPQIAMYWSSSRLFCIPIFCDTMSTHRFQDILRFFHTCNNMAIPADNTDRLIKARTIMEYFSAAFKSVYTPMQELSLDEGTLPWHGHLSFKWFQIDKPDKCGIKLFLLAEAKTGYICNLDVYTGVSRRNEELVCILVEHLQHKGYKLYTDNFYNSVAVCATLYSLGVQVCGTLRLVRGALKQL